MGQQRLQEELLLSVLICPNPEYYIAIPQKFRTNQSTSHTTLTNVTGYGLAISVDISSQALKKSFLRELPHLHHLIFSGVRTSPIIGNLFFPNKKYMVWKVKSYWQPRLHIPTWEQRTFSSKPQFKQQQNLNSTGKPAY